MGQSRRMMIDDELSSVLFSDTCNVTNTPPERSSMVQAEPVEGADTRNSDDNKQPIPGIQSQQDSPFELQPERGSSNGPSSMGTAECIDQLIVMFPDMSRAALERTLHFWNNDMQRTVTAILGADKGLSRAITEYLVTEDVNSCLPHLSEEDIPDLDIREILKQIRDAETEDQLIEVTNKDETVMLLTQSGFMNEFVSLRHRACQCIMIHAVFKSRREELEQLREGLESLSIITFLTLSAACVKYVFPLQSEVEVRKEDLINLIGRDCGSQRTAMDWFLQYVNEVNDNNAVSEMDRQFSTLPNMAQLLQFISGHPYLPSSGLHISFSQTAVYPDADSCFFFLRLPTIHNNYQQFKNAMNTAITCQYLGYGRG